MEDGPDPQVRRLVGLVADFWGSLGLLSHRSLTWRQAPEVLGEGCGSVEVKESSCPLSVPLRVSRLSVPLEFSLVKHHQLRGTEPECLAPE